jgi:hypothetical protein
MAVDFDSTMRCVTEQVQGGVVARSWEERRSQKSFEGSIENDK